jgi:hypothetical protein
VVHAVVSLGQNVRQPARTDLTQTQPLPMTTLRKVLVQQVRQSQALLLRHQQGNIVYSFTGYGKYLGHAESLPHFSKLG